ncbi:MAG: hypothetical protein ACRYE7_02465 [Janthinobacterium lividum]
MAVVAIVDFEVQFLEHVDCVAGIAHTCRHEIVPNLDDVGE